MISTPAPKPSRPPQARRPIRSDSHENETRPKKPTTVSRSIILEACCGVTLSSSTNSVGAQSATP